MPSPFPSRTMLSDIINKLLYPNILATISVSVSIILLGFWSVIYSSFASAAVFTCIAYLWLWRLVAINLRVASKYTRFCWVGTFVMETIFLSIIAARGLVLVGEGTGQRYRFDNSRAWAFPNPTLKVIHDIPFAAIYVQLQRHSRRMAGEKDRLERWLHTAGVLCIVFSPELFLPIFGIVAWSLYSKSNRHRSEMKGINSTCLALICLGIAYPPIIWCFIFFANPNSGYEKSPLLVHMAYGGLVVIALCATPFFAAIYNSMRQDEENNSAVSDHVDTFEDMPDGYTMDEEISDDELDR